MGIRGLVLNWKEVHTLVKLSDLIKVTVANLLVKLGPKMDPRDHTIQPLHFSDE